MFAFNFFFKTHSLCFVFGCFLSQKENFEGLTFLVKTQKKFFNNPT